MNRQEAIYCRVGEALHLGQTLELYIVALTSILNEHFGARLDGRQLFLESDKQTLGKLIMNLKKHGSLDDTGSGILQEALEGRNYIVHDFFRRNTYAFSVDKANESAVEKLGVVTTNLARAVALMQGFLDAFCSAFKLKLNDILVEQDF